jgi:hypothetical protein
LKNGGIKDIIGESVTGGKYKSSVGKEEKNEEK